MGKGVYLHVTGLAKLYRTRPLSTSSTTLSNGEETKEWKGGWSVFCNVIQDIGLTGKSKFLLF